MKNSKGEKKVGFIYPLQYYYIYTHWSPLHCFEYSIKVKDINNMNLSSFVIYKIFGNQQKGWSSESFDTYIIIMNFQCSMHMLLFLYIKSIIIN